MPIDIEVSVASPDVEPTNGAVVTPELALVDRVLAAAERERLPPPGDTLSVRPTGSRRGSEPLGSAYSHRQAGRPMSGTPLSGIPRGLRRRLLRLSAKQVAAIAALLALVVFVSARAIEFEETAPRMTTESAQKTGTAQLAGSPQGAAGRPRGAAAKRARPRSFAWAPVADASAYRVEFYRAAERIFVGEARRAQIVIPARWRFAGALHRLAPGEYRWYVWPIVDGRRLAAAIVQAKLTIDG